MRTHIHLKSIFPCTSSTHPVSTPSSQLLTFSLLFFFALAHRQVGTAYIYSYKRDIIFMMNFTVLKWPLHDLALQCSNTFGRVFKRLNNNKQITAMSSSQYMHISQPYIGPF